MEVKLTTEDLKQINIPRRKDELPTVTAMLYLSINNEPLTYKGAMEGVATSISLRYGYPIWQEITQKNPNWEKVYCEKVLDIAIQIIKNRENKKDSEGSSRANPQARIENAPRKKSHMRQFENKKKRS